MTFSLKNMRFSPVFFLSITSLLGALLAFSAISATLSPPWLGLQLVQNIEQDTIDVQRKDLAGPSKDLPSPARLLSIADIDGNSITLMASDKVEEPDVFATYPELEVFMARHAKIDSIFNQQKIVLTLAYGNDEVSEFEVTPGKRPLRSLPFVFWIQVFVGISGIVVGPWVFSIRRNWASGFFAFGGLGLAVSASAASVYSSRELALDPVIFHFGSIINFSGTLLYGMSSIALFLTYPRKVIEPRILLGAIIFFGVVLLACRFQVAPEFLSLRPNTAVAIEMVLLLICVGIQFFLTKGDPRGRAAIKWLGLSVLVGAGGFVILSIAPDILGQDRIISQGHAFLFFLFIYIGLALGILRYRLFDLEEWSFRVMFYLGAAAVLMALDAALVLLVSFNNLPAFSISLLAVTFLYLPLRDVFARWFIGRKGAQTENLYNSVIDIAFAPTRAQRSQDWQALLARLFRPLNTVEHDNATLERAQVVPRLSNDGLFLELPAIKSIPPMTLEYAHDGRKLFSPRDVTTAKELVAMLGHAIENRFAHEKGVSQERERIARDIHDNIGAQLLSALHSSDPNRKDTMIRETLTDLRDIINNSSGQEHSLEEVLADLRVETVERLSENDVTLDWINDTQNLPALSPQLAYAIRSVIREAVSNVIKHAEAQNMSVLLTSKNASISLVLIDDGIGMQNGDAGAGNGLVNMESRVSGMGGQFEILPSHPGTQITARFPLNDTDDPS